MTQAIEEAIGIAETEGQTQCVVAATAELAALLVRDRLLKEFWRARRAALFTQDGSPEWQAFDAARAALYSLLEAEENL